MLNAADRVIAWEIIPLFASQRSIFSLSLVLFREVKHLLHTCIGLCYLHNHLLNEESMWSLCSVQGNEWGGATASYLALRNNQFEFKTSGKSPTHCRGILWNNIPLLIKENWKMFTCNRLAWEVLGYWPIMSKILPGHWSRLIFGHNQTKSQCFQVQLVTCCDLSIIFCWFEHFSVPLKWSVILLKLWTSNQYLSKSTNSFVTSSWFQSTRRNLSATFLETPTRQPLTR